MYRCLPICMAAALMLTGQSNPPLINAGAAEGPRGTWHSHSLAGPAVWVATDAAAVDSSSCGTEAAPCRTIRHALTRVAAGAARIIKLRAGATPFSESVVLSTSGTDAAPFAIVGVRSSSGARPKLVVASTATAGPIVFDAPAAKWIIEGLELNCSARYTPGVQINAGVHSVALRDMDISNCYNSAVHISSGTDIFVERSTLHDNPTISDGGDKDSNGVTIEKSSARILVSGNTMHTNGGDGVQVQGREQSGGGVENDPTNITIVDNVMYRHTEQAIDLKSSLRVTVRGNVMRDHYAASRCGNTNVVVHFNAREILFEHNEFYNSGAALNIGGNTSQTDLTPGALVVRRNIVRNLCSDAINVVKVANPGIEIFHNTFAAVTGSGIRIAPDPAHTFAAPVRIWNNVLSGVSGQALNVNTAGADATQLFIDHQQYQGAGTTAKFRWGPSWNLSFASWRQESGRDVNSAEGNPLFTGAQDFTLATGSPARNTARVDGGNAGSNQRCGGMPDKGAIESDCGTDISGHQGPAVWTLVQGTPAEDAYRAAAANAAGYVYGVGSSRGSYGYANQGGLDAFVERLNPTGSRQWVRLLGSAADEEALGAAVTPDGGVIATGRTSGPLYTGHKGARDVFVVRYGPTGTRDWIAPQLGTAADDEGRAVAVDQAGNIIVAGVTSGALGSSAAGGKDAFLARYSPTGALVWVRQFGSSADDEANAIAVDGSANIYVAGTTFSSLHGTQAGAGDLFVAKFDAAGNRQWLMQRGTPALDAATAIASDAAGNLTVAGHSAGAFAYTYQGGSADAIVLRVSAAGQLVWSRQLGSAGTERAAGVAVGSSGEAWVGGTVSGPLYTSHFGADDVWMTKYEKDGTRAWLRQQGSSRAETLSGVALGPDGVYACGTTGSAPASGANDTLCYKFAAQ